MKHPQLYRGENVVVLGLAKSGVAVAKRFHELGARVTVNDRKERRDCPEADELEAMGIRVVCGGHPPLLIDRSVALVVKNPGIFYTAEPVARALELGIEVVTEVEVAAWLSKAPIIGITGSNGKTTTTTLVGLALEAAGKRPIVAGNIGRALCDAAAEADAGQILVAELSSFQLKGTVAFRPRIACLLNLYPTHLDYHGGMDDYAASKAKLFANQQDGDIAVINWDDAFCRSLLPSLKAEVLPFSLRESLAHGVFVGEEPGSGKRTIVYRNRSGDTQPILSVDRLIIPGEFNVENALAAAAVSLAAGAEPSAIASVLASFRGVEHRTEYVDTIGGVDYYNNSKATNPAATIKAIEAFDRPIVLIAGGLDRDMEFTELLPYFRRNVKAVVAIGQTADKIIRIAEEAGVPAERIRDDRPAAAMARAVEAAGKLAAPGDVVLLSPACASWDMFASFEERGRIFKQAVHNL